MCTNKCWGLFFVILKLYPEKLAQCMLFNVLPISFYYLWPSLRQHTDTALKKSPIFWGDPRIDPISGFLIRSEVLLIQAMSHPPEQMVVRRSNVWRISGWGRTSQLSASKVSFTILATCDRALSCWKITLSCHRRPQSFHAAEISWKLLQGMYIFFLVLTN